MMKGAAKMHLPYKVSAAASAAAAAGERGDFQRHYNDSPSAGLPFFILRYIKYRAIG